jgi:small subunit ribosomal protein S9
VEAAPAEAASTPETPPTPEPAPEAAPEPKILGASYTWGLGRRKTAIARVRVRPGSGKYEINGRSIDRFFTEIKDRQCVTAPLDAVEAADKVDVFINVTGGGYSGQSGAIVQGLARALTKLNRDYEETLRDRGFMTRDSRMVERKKYGQRGARRRFQFSKR